MIARIAADRGIASRSIASGGGPARPVVGRPRGSSSRFTRRLLDDAGHLVPPGEPRRLQERGGQEERRRDAPFAQDRRGDLEVVAIAVVEGDQRGGLAPRAPDAIRSMASASVRTRIRRPSQSTWARNDSGVAEMTGS